MNNNSTQQCRYFILTAISNMGFSPLLDYSPEGNLEIYLKEGNVGLLITIGNELKFYGDDGLKKWRMTFQTSSEVWKEHVDKLLINLKQIVPLQ